MTGSYQVTWPEYASNRTSCLNDLLKRNVFVDVTLVFDDEQIAAHKVILSSASSFFLQVLEKNVSHPHPMLYMKGVDKKLFSFLLDFIYLGEVSIPEDQFDRFILMSRELKVKGLLNEPVAEDTVDFRKKTNSKNPTLQEEIPEYTPIDDFILNTSNIDDPDPIGSPVKETKVNVAPLLKQKRMRSTPLESPRKVKKFESNKKSPIKIVKREIPVKDVTKEVVHSKEDTSPNTNADILAKVNALLVTTPEGFWVCNECRYGSKNKENVMEHAETHIEGIVHKCNGCNRVFSKKTSLKNHLIKCTKMIRK